MLQPALCILAEMLGYELLDTDKKAAMNGVEKILRRDVPFVYDRRDVLVGDDKWIVVREFSSNRSGRLLNSEAIGSRIGKHTY